MRKNSLSRQQAGFAHIFLLIFLIVGLVVAVYLVGQQTNIFPKAYNKITSLRPSSTETGQTQTVPVLVLKYFPLDSSGAKLDASITGNGDNLDNIRRWTTENTNQVAEKLTEATKYHGYKDPTAQSALKYQLLETKEFLKAVPTKYWPEISWRYSDYRKMLTEDVDVCDYVDNKGVKDVWIWSYQTEENGIFESNMSMGNISRAFWDNQTYGDVSNDHRNLNDLPQCNKTYVVYNFNYRDSGGVGNMIHDYMHQIEQEFMFVDYRFFGNMYTGKPRNFAGPRRCGNTHTPPNLELGEYNYTVETSVRSDCEDWQAVDCTSISNINADCGGSRAEVNCRNWGCNEIGYYVWWMQNLPGLGSDLTFEGQPLRNWWEFMGDFDTALAKGKYSAVPVPPTPTPTPHLGLTMSTNAINLNVSPGSTTKAFDITSVDAKRYGVSLYDAIRNQSGIKLKPDFGNISSGNTVSVNLEVAQNTPFGKYQGRAWIESDRFDGLPYELVMTLGEYIPITVTVAAPFVCTPCAADIVKDARNRIDAKDNALLNSCFGKPLSTVLSGGRSCAAADIKPDGVINQEDADCLRSVYFQSCAAN